jgi:hypothetical protein
MTEYQINTAGDVSLHVPVEVAERLRIAPGAPLNNDMLGDLREALNLPRLGRMRDIHFPSKKG